MCVCVGGGGGAGFEAKKPLWGIGYFLEEHNREVRDACGQVGKKMTLWDKYMYCFLLLGVLLFA